MKVEGNKIILSFDEIGKGLTTFRRPFTGFEIAGEDRIFHPADARLGEGAQTVVVSNPEVKHPVAVRYALKIMWKVAFLICLVFRRLLLELIIGNN